jgi:surface protein
MKLALGLSIDSNKVAAAAVAVAPSNSVAPVISGSASVGSILTTTDGTWTGTLPITFTYQWYRGATLIASATSSTYTTQPADIGFAVSCQVTGTNIAGASTASSNVITPTAIAPVNTVAPVISGSTPVGSILTTTDGTWTGTPTPTFTYQWFRDGGATLIGGATSSTYTTQPADIGSAVTCIVTGTNPGGSATATSNSITPTAIAPSNSVAPVISGSTPVGSTLTTTDGTWTGTPTPTFTYQWYRGASSIGGATASTYVTIIADTSLAVTCQVTGTNIGGSATATSNSITPTAVVTPFAFTAKTDNTGVSTSTQFKLPLTTSTGLNAVVDWGDATTSTITSHTSPDITHTYASAGTYSISITGTLPGWQFNNGGDRRKILNISSWGVLDITTNAIFRGCTNLTSNATDYPTITTTNLLQTFTSCTNFNGAIGNWNTSAVTNMASMFEGASAFNQPLSFDTGAVTNMSYMFLGATAFNQSLSFNTAAVTNMSTMFRSANAFNQPLTWNTGAVTNMYSMFRQASSFNSALNFDTAAVTDMGYMFSDATAFNQDIGSWNVANVTNFGNFMSTKTPATFSTTNLDAIYNGWVTVQSSRTITFGSAKYSAAGTAGRNYLTGTKLWTITDGGL